MFPGLPATSDTELTVRLCETLDVLFVVLIACTLTWVADFDF